MDPDEVTMEPEGDGDGAEEAVSRDEHVAVIHDSFGEKYVNVATLEARAVGVTVERVLSALNMEPRGIVSYFVNGQPASAGTTVAPGDSIYIVGKLAGGR
jgi:sulfur carrier protein ThiS